MTYRVVFTPDVAAAIREHALYIAADNFDAAERWFVGIWQQIDTLKSMPRRYPVAPVESAALGLEIRKLIAGNFLAFYTVDDSRGIVEVLRFRHAARQSD